MNLHHLMTSLSPWRMQGRDVLGAQWHGMAWRGSARHGTDSKGTVWRVTE